MTDNNIFALVVLAILALLLGGLIFGTKLENNRVYDKCMRENENVIHVEAKKLCTERIK